MMEMMFDGLKETIRMEMIITGLFLLVITVLLFCILAYVQSIDRSDIAGKLEDIKRLLERK